MYILKKLIYKNKSEFYCTNDTDDTKIPRVSNKTGHIVITTNVMSHTKTFCRKLISSEQIIINTP